MGDGSTANPEDARVQLAREIFKKYYARCFWFADPNLLIEAKDISWVREQLMKNGNQEAWKEAQRLCP